MLYISLLFGQDRQQPDLMSYEEYARTSCPVPYVLTLEVREGSLLYFGAKHSYDSSDPQHVEIEKQWQTSRPTVAFTEGGVPPLSTSAADAIAHHGEAGLVRFLAHRDGIPVYSLEPDLAQEVSHLRQGFSSEQLKVFYVLRQVEPVKKRGHANSLDDQIRGLLAWLSRVPELDHCPGTLKELEASYQKLMGRQNWREVRSEWFDPVSSPPRTYLNEVSRASSRFRDDYMIHLLVEHVRQGKRVFAVVGSTHVIVQERALRASLKSN